MRILLLLLLLTTLTVAEMNKLPTPWSFIAEMPGVKLIPLDPAKVSDEPLPEGMSMAVYRVDGNVDELLAGIELGCKKVGVECFIDSS